MKTVSEVMRRGERNAIMDEGSCFREVLETMNEKGLGSSCIVRNGRLVGIVTDGDVRRLILKTQDTLPELFLKGAGKLMTKEPKTVSLGTSLGDCLTILKKCRFWVIPVVDNEKMLLGVVHMQDLLEAMNG